MLGCVVAETHPSRIRAVARLLGHQAPPAAGARVLDVGCGLGGNLVGIGLTLPGSECVGVDIAADEVAAARKLASSVGADNVRFEAVDLATLPADLGTFDYIVAHGVYPAVPAAVRDALLAVIAERLTASGVALVSINTQPGWADRLVVRDLIVRAVDGIEDRSDRVKAARDVLSRAARYADPDTPWGAALGVLHSGADAELFRELLAEVSEPVWFHEFHDHAAAHELQYLCEASLPETAGAGLSEAANNGIDALGSELAARETLKDVLLGRGSRSSLLIRAGSEPDRAPTPARMAGLHFTTDLEPDDEGGYSGRRGAVQLPPGSVRDAVERARDALPGNVAIDDVSHDPAVPLNILGLASVEFCDIQSEPIPALPAVPAHPAAWPLARHYAEAGAHAIPTRRHECATLGPDDLRALLLLDGKRDHAALARAAPRGTDMAGAVERFWRAGLLA